MKVNKVLIGFTFIIILLLIVGSIFKRQAPIMDLASTTNIYQAIRVGILLLLVGLAISSPPRSLLFRSLLLVGVMTLVLSALYCLFSYSANIIDSIVFTEVAIIFGIEALELPQVSKSPPVHFRRKLSGN